MAKIQFDIRKTDGGQSVLLKDPNCVYGLWADERETILARIGAIKGRPEVGLKLYSVSFYSEKEWIIRCIEIVNSIDAREKSNITTSIKVPARFYRKGQQILSIFEAINKDVKKQMPSPSSELLSLLDYSDSDAKWSCSKQNGKFGIKTFANPTELVDLLDNILQPDYHNYQAIYFIPIECKFHPDMNYVLLPNGIDKLVSKKFDSQEPIKGVIFRPEQSHITIFESQILQTKVKWLCDGYRTIEKSFANTTITPDEVYRKIDKNDYFSVIPSGTSIVCSLDGRKVNEENGSFYLRWDMLDKCEFVISKVGYEQKKCKLSNQKQTITLSEKSSEINVKFCANKEQYYAIPIVVLPSYFQDYDMEGMVLCTQNYFSSLQPASENTTNERKSSISLGRSMLIILFCATLLVGGYCLGHFPTSKDYETNVRNLQYTIYVQSDEWYKGNNNNHDILEPKGLWDAMNTYNYDSIENIYELYKDSIISEGRLKDVIDCIGSLHSPLKRGSVSYFTTSGKPINIDEWIQKVHDANSRDKSIENYLAAPIWRKNKCTEEYEKNNNFKTKEPDGLWDAMNQYNYEQIRRIYKDLNSRGYNCGNLKKVYNFLQSNNPKEMNTTYCPSDPDGIKVDNWINRVKASSGGGGSGGSPTSFKCQYCGTAFTSTAKCNQHENTCSKNPAKSGTVAD